ncbi:MAG: MG2 domain-containing protein [Myxococcota bacterium]
MTRVLVWLGLLVACSDRRPVSTTSPPTVEAVAPETAPRESPRLPLDSDAAAFFDAIEPAWERGDQRRAMLQVDKPLYRPGETIWFRLFDLRHRTLDGEGAYPVTAELIDPRGATVFSKRLRNDGGSGFNDFELPPGVAGGRYLVRVSQTARGKVVERPVIVASFEAPRVKKTLDFVRKAYGEGDKVAATVKVERATGAALANHALTAVVDLDGRELTRFVVTTNAQGEARTTFTLPEAIDFGDGLLTVLVEDGGVTESISRPIPIVLSKVDLALFPEGGDRVAGLPGRIYLRALTPRGKPADIGGRVLDADGSEITTFRTVRDGLGRFSLPAGVDEGTVVIDEPAGITTTLPLPEPKPDGCAMHVYDDVTSMFSAIRVGLRCTDPLAATVHAMVRNRPLDAATVQVDPGKETVVYLQPDDMGARQQGVARVTLFVGDVPVAERLVYRNLGVELNVAVEAKPGSATPREDIALTVKTTDPQGQPIAASVGLAVVDDTLLSYADDEFPHLLAATYLTPDLPYDLEAYELNRYFDPETPDRAVALDRLLGTHGWRRFEWKRLTHTPSWLAALETEHALADNVVDIAEVEAEEQAAPRRERRRKRPMAPLPVEAPPPEAEPVGDELPMRDAKAPQEEVADGDFAFDKALEMEDEGKQKMEFGAGRFDDRLRAANVMKWSVARVFPVPPPQPAYDGPRTDFRQTIFWKPDVQTDDNGQATVHLTTSDAITSFRVVAEGVGGGAVGRTEHVFENVRPFSLNIKLPVALTQGDQLQLPVTLASEVNRPLTVQLTPTFGPGLTVADPSPRPVALPARGRDTVWFDVKVEGPPGTTSIGMAAIGGGQSDEMVRDLEVHSRGFPQTFEASTSIDDRETWTIDLAKALPNSVTASVRLYPEPVATLTEGMEGLLREPNGCFEQTSSSNYPNLMVLRYLQQHDVADASLQKRASELLERGYAKLVGYETAERGYEWFGSTPAHEALTAYGLVEFVDMQEVFGGVDRAMIDRTRDYLLSRRDGKGGFLRSSQALDSFGRAPDDVTDAYILWSLTRAGTTTNLNRELERTRDLARSTTDPYLLALATNTLLNLEDPSDGRAALKRLLALQADDGGFPGAKTSITRSGGRGLDIEATALAVLAMIKGDAPRNALRKAVAFLNEARGGYGAFGSTQATVLALDALTAYASASRATRAPSRTTVRLNDEVVGTHDTPANFRGAIEFTDFASAFELGSNTLVVDHEGESMPLSVVVDYRTVEPASADEGTVDVTTRLDKARVAMGETLRLTARIENRTAEGQPMALARIGLPGGLTAAGWQLEDLRKQGTVDFYETTPREVVLYFRDLGPREAFEVGLDLTAEVPGTYEGPASQGYLYYTNELRRYAAGLEVTITR